MFINFLKNYVITIKFYGFKPLSHKCCSISQKHLGSFDLFHYFVFLVRGGSRRFEVLKMTNFKPPVDVSPLIRFGRWSLLLTGIAYGAFWQRRYTNYELSMKDIKEKERAARDARIQAEKQRKSETDVAELMKLAGGTK